MSVLLQVFAEFFKIGLFAVGGGPATIPFLIELTQKYDWFSMQDLTTMIAVAESTPGPIGLNMATYAGYQTLGVFGGIVSSIGLVIPSLIVITIIAKYFSRMNENATVQAAFSGIRPAVTAIIASAVIGICRVSLFVTENGVTEPAWKPIVLCVIIFALLQIKALKKLHPVLWFVLGAAAGIVFSF